MKASAILLLVAVAAVAIATAALIGTSAPSVSTSSSVATTTTSNTTATTTGTTPMTGSGTLVAQVSIGPTQPVCMANSTTGPAPYPYSSIQVVVTSSSGHNLTLPVNWLSNGCEASGTVQTALDSGTYQFSLSSCPFMGCKVALPKSFTVIANQTTRLAISIDTGIR